MQKHQPYSQLQSLPVLLGLSKSLSMDFITDLLLNRLQKEVYNSILVIINYFTKLGTYILCKKSINTKELADIVTEKVFNIYSYLDSIITNQESLFTNGF
jgi:hypothetical protein